MIIYVNTSVFTLPCNVLVNPVNCEGVMGKGLAKVFKDRYPDEMFAQYKQACKEGLRPGLLHVWVGHQGTVVNFPTKLLYKYNSSLEWIDRGLNNLVYMINLYKWEKIALPALGCGEGKLEWCDVKALIEKHLSTIDCTCYVCEPQIIKSLTEGTIKQAISSKPIDHTSSKPEGIKNLVKKINKKL